MKGSNSQPGPLIDRSKYQGRVSGLHPAGSREAGRQPEPEGKGLLQSWPPPTGILHQTGSWLSVAKHVFLESWMADFWLLPGG